MTLVCGSSLKYSMASASSISARLPRLTKTLTPNWSWEAQSMRAAPTVPLWEMKAMPPWVVSRGQEAQSF